MTFGSVGEVDDDGVIEHRAVAFRHGVQLLGQAGDEVEVEAADHVVGFRPRHTVLATAVARVVLALLETQSAETDVEIADTGR